MEKTYKPLVAKTLEAGAGVEQAAFMLPQPVGLSSPAVDVMTDLRAVSAATVDADVTAEQALQIMVARGVRSLLVLEREGVVGLITARDLQGERPMQVVQSHGIKHDEVLVKHIMTPRDVIEVLDIGDVINAKVGHILSTLKHAGRQHALVIGRDVARDRQMVRGVFSLSQIARQLGLPLQATELAKTFAEIEQAFTH